MVKFFFLSTNSNFVSIGNIKMVIIIGNITMYVSGFTLLQIVTKVTCSVIKYRVNNSI